MSTDKTPTIRRAVDRRTVTTGLAWSVPAVAATAAAPSFAASLVKNPGINGWVNNAGRGRVGCQRQLTVNSNVQGVGDDGAPFGLYLYDTDPRGVYDAAKLVYWVRGNHRDRAQITWSAGSSHSDCWSGPTVGAPEEKSDGALYTPYTWTYTCEINPENVSEDGRLYLGHFNVVSSWFDQRDNRGRCLPLDIWTYREIRIDPDGDGVQEPELQHFERRASLYSGGFPYGREQGVDEAEGAESSLNEDLSVQSAAS